MVDLAKAGRRFGATVDNYSNGHIVRLPAAWAEMATYFNIDESGFDTEAFAAAWEIVRLGLPVSPIREHNGQPWRWPLHPAAIVEVAENAESDDLSYLEQLSIHHAAKEERAARLQHEAEQRCGRTTKTGQQCRQRALYQPGKGFVDGYPCHLHLSPQEEAELRGQYDKAVAANPCPGCGAAAGQVCDVGESARLTRIGDVWPATRGFREFKIHDVRAAASP